MANPEVYEPTEADIQKAEESMTERDILASRMRAEDLKHLREFAGKIGFDLDTEELSLGSNKFSFEDSESEFYKIEGRVKGHHLQFEQSAYGPRQWIQVKLDGEELQSYSEDGEDAGRLGGDLWQRFGLPVLNELRERVVPHLSNEGINREAAAEKRRKRLELAKSLLAS
jgi:hypothetical protein